MLSKVLIIIAVLVGLFFLAGFFTHGKDEVLRGTPLENASFKNQGTQSCPDPLVLQTPVDIDRVTGILYPGQERGGHFKWHGGFRFDGSAFDEIEVRAPLDAKITDASRYIEQGKVQYMFDFQTDCGLRYRFDHLVTLSPKLEEVAKNLPEPKADDSRTSRVSKDVFVVTGEVIATAVGYEENVFVDLGVYDTRGKNPFGNFQENAICWFDLLPASDSARIKSLPLSGPEGSKSTICK